ncbi:MAG: tetratricopeptide repeat protein [Aureliella sp.]
MKTATKFQALTALLASLLLLTSLSPQASGQEKKPSNNRAMAYYADAASFQNNGAFDLAIDEWNKLLKEYPSDPLAGKAWHYLGVCYSEMKPPKLKEAIEAFENSLKKSKLDIRDETLIRVAESIFTLSRTTGGQEKGLKAAKGYLIEFLNEYGDRGAADRALFYLGEIEYALGDSRRSIAYHKRLLSDEAFKKSKLRPSARYAVAVAYEEQENLRLAENAYSSFLTEFPSHTLSDEVRVRLADILIRGGKNVKATELLGSLATKQDTQVADYALLRLAYALSLENQSEKAINYYRDLLNRFPKSQHAPTARLSLGQLLSSAGRLDEAEEMLSSAIAKKDEQAAQALHWLATNLLKQNKAEQAEQRLAQAQSWTSGTESHTSLLMDYADALFAQPSKLAESQAAYEKIVEVAPKNALAPRAAYNAAFSALLSRKLGDARKWAEYFLSNFPSDPLRLDVTYVAAEALLQQGEHKAAATAYQKLCRSAKDHPSINAWTLRHAMANYLGGQYSDAQKVLAPAMKQFREPSELAEAQFILGACHLYSSEIPQAVSQLQASHKTSDNWTSADEVLLLLAEAQQRSGDTSSAKATLESLLAKFPNTRLKQQVTYKLAQLSAAMNRYDDAISGYRKVLADPEAANLHRFSQYGIAWALMQQERYDDALIELDRIPASRLPDSISLESQLARGLCQRKTGQPEKAIDSLRQFLSQNPSGNSLGNGLYELGLAYTATGNAKEATKAFERIRDEVPNYPASDKVLYELAWNNLDANKKTKAAEYFNELATKFADSDFAAEAVYMIAQDKYDAGKYAQAAKDYTRAINSSTDPALLEKSLYKLGWSHFQLEQYDEASKYFSRQAREHSRGPLAVDGKFMAAECAFNRDQYDAALTLYKEARDSLKNSPNSVASKQIRALIYLHGAQCYRERKDWDECERWLRIVLDEYRDSPHTVTAEYELGYCKQKQGKTAEALKLYNRVADANPRSEIGARSRFMSGEVYFSQRDFVNAIRDFQRVMYGFGAAAALPEVKNWQAKAAFEAARCSEVLAEDRRGNDREQILGKAQEYYDFILQQHGKHDLARQARSRLGELQNLR